MTSPFTLDGMRIAITGAGGGIGSTTARLAADLGADVMVSDLHAPEAAAEYARARGRRESKASALDTTDRGAVEAWADGCGAVDALIDCAAICPFDAWTDDGWDETAARVFDVNLRAPIHLARAFMGRMAERGGGRIAMVGSIAGRIGGLRAAPHYVMSKGGIHSFVRWLARRGAQDNILVNAVAPGPVATPMTASQTFHTSEFPLGRMANAEEIAGPLVFLVSPAASYVSGAILDVNGALYFS